MTDLKDITLYLYIYHLNEAAKTRPELKPLASFMIKNRIYDFARLKKVMDMSHPLVSTSEFEEMMRKADNLLSKINYAGKDIQKIAFTSPTGEHKDLIAKTDKTTKLQDITIYNPVKRNFLSSNISVYTAKYLLGKITLNGKNALETFLPNIGSDKLSAIIASLMEYDAQIKRVASITRSDYPSSLFTKNAEMKRKMILADIIRLTEYLLANGESFIWGELTPKQQDKLMQSVAMDASSAPKENLTNMLANYTTTREINNDLIRSRTLDRFIR